MTTLTFSAVADVALVGGRWRVGAEIARGGMGIVYEGTDELTGDVVAIKILKDGVDATALARFAQEAEVAARIESKHAVRIFGSGTTSTQRPFLVMELLRGEDLGAYVARVGRLPLDEVAGYAVQACDALARAHAAGIVHRDIKPSNLFRHVEADGTVVIKLVDFGISKSFARESTLTSDSEGAILGSPAYMSPEQIRDARTVDQRSDLWSLGVVCYRLLTGETPWGSTRIEEIFGRILSSDGLPSLEARGLPRGIDDVLARCVAARREDRWPDAETFARAMSIYAAETSTLVMATTGEALPTVAIPTLCRDEGIPVETDVRRWQGWTIAAAAAIVVAGASSLAIPHRESTAVATPPVEVASTPAPVVAPASVPAPPPAATTVVVVPPTPVRRAPIPTQVRRPVNNASAPASAAHRELQPNPYARGDAP